MRAAVDSLCSEFTTVKQTVIRSRSLRIPELFFTFALVVAMLSSLLHKLTFLEEVQLGFETHVTFKHTMTNWWRCDSDKGNCEYDLPGPAYTNYCTQEQKVRVYDEENQTYATRKRMFPCRPFDVSKDLRVNRDNLLITTFVSEMHEARDSANASWRQVPQQQAKKVFTVGAEQMVALSAAIPQRLGVHSMGKVQSFLSYQRSGAEARIARIPCANKRELLPDCPDVPAGKYWSSNYETLRGARAHGPEDSAATDTADDFFAFNSTGCIQVNGSDSVVCHLSELLEAAGVDLDHVGEGDDTSPRTKKLTLYVLVTLTNRDVRDYWHWPIGPKPKFVFEVKSGRASSPLETSYENDEMDSTPRKTRKVLEHYGIDLRIYSSLSWGVFDLEKLLGVLVIALGVLKYGNMVVTSVLVHIYSWLGCAHVSRLYRYNASTRSAMEKDVEGLLDPTEFKSRHHQANQAYLQQLFNVEAWAGVDDSNSCASSSDSGSESKAK